MQFKKSRLSPALSHHACGFGKVELIPVLSCVQTEVVCILLTNESCVCGVWSSGSDLTFCLIIGPQR